MVKIVAFICDLQVELVIVYCGSVVTACVNLWSFRLAGINTGKLSAGSWSNWYYYLVLIKSK